MDLSLFPVISGVICFMCVYMSLRALTTQLQYESEVLDLRHEAHDLRTNYMNRLKASRPVPQASSGLAEPWPEEDDVESEVEEGQDADAVVDAEETADDGVILV